MSSASIPSLRTLPLLPISPTEFGEPWHCCVVKGTSFLSRKASCVSQSQGIFFYTGPQFIKMFNTKYTAKNIWNREEKEMEEDNQKEDEKKRRKTEKRRGIQNQFTLIST